MPVSAYPSMDEEALMLAMELSQFSLNTNGSIEHLTGSMTGPIATLDMLLSTPEDPIRLGKKSQNMTECVPVPSSEHVAEIVGRQGCKIKSLRAKTNTYIKTPVRGEEPVFVVTGRKEDVAKAKKEIQSAADHFSQIRASRKNNLGAPGSLSSHGPSNLGPDSVTIHVRVPYRVVGLVVGPKGGTIKRIQSSTNTYIVTPSREKDPIFEVTGTRENAQLAQEAIMQHIANRTNTSSDGNQLNMVSDILGPNSFADDELFTRLYNNGINNMNDLMNMNLFDLPMNNVAATNNSSFGSLFASGSGSSSAFSSSGSVSSNSSSRSSANGFSDKSIWSNSLDRDEGLGCSPPDLDAMWPLTGYPESSNGPSPTSSSSPTDYMKQHQQECINCCTDQVTHSLMPCGHSCCHDCATAYTMSSESAKCFSCSNNVSQVIRLR